MMGSQDIVDADGNICFHVKAGAKIPVQFQNEDGSPRDMTGSEIFFETDDGTRVQLQETDNSDVLMIVLQGSAFTGYVNKIGQFVVLDEGVTPPEELWAGKLAITGWV
jgi:hypothetical protein